MYLPTQQQQLTYYDVQSAEQCLLMQQLMTIRQVLAATHSWLPISVKCALVPNCSLIEKLLYCLYSCVELLQYSRLQLIYIHSKWVQQALFTQLLCNFHSDLIQQPQASIVTLSSSHSLPVQTRSCLFFQQLPIYFFLSKPIVLISLNQDDYTHQQLNN